MKAIAYTQTGPAAEVLKLIDLPTPEPGPGEVRVRLRWSGVNPSDVKSRAGLRTKTLAFPQIVPHSDGAGEIDAVGAGVPATRVGQSVWVWNGAWQRAHGTAAQYIVVPVAQAVPLHGASGEAGACLGIPALTALHAVLTGGGVAGQRVLVAGGAGAVGHYAVQFARRLGAAQVVATVSSEAKARLAISAGADATIDYKREELGARAAALTGGAGFDRIIEVDAAANAAADLALLRAGGDVVIYGSGAGEFVGAVLPGHRQERHAALLHRLQPERRRSRARGEHAQRHARARRAAAQHRRAAAAGRVCAGASTGRKRPGHRQRGAAHRLMAVALVGVKRRPVTIWA